MMVMTAKVDLKKALLALAAAAALILSLILLLGGGSETTQTGAPAVSSVLSGLRPAVVALIASAGLSILLSAAFTEMPDSPSALFSAFRPGSAILFLIAFAILRIRKWNPVLILCLCGAAGLLTCAVTGSAGYL